MNHKNIHLVIVFALFLGVLAAVFSPGGEPTTAESLVQDDVSQPASLEPAVASSHSVAHT